MRIFFYILKLLNETLITFIICLWQVCALVRCAGLDASSCGQEVEEAESKMDFLLEGKFGTRYVYPSVLVSKRVLEQPEHLETAADGRVTMKHSNMTGGLVSACLYGRMYHLDNE